MWLVHVALFILLLEMTTILADKGIDIDLRSFACEDQFSGHYPNCLRPQVRSWIKVNRVGVLKPNRGWNIVVVNHYTGAVEMKDRFDTSVNVQENKRLAGFIRRIPDKRLVLGVIHDDAGHRLTQGAITALNSVGGYGFKKGFRVSAAFVGYKDYLAPPDNLLERHFPKKRKGPASVRVTIGKITRGDDMHFTLQSIGYLDRGRLTYHQMSRYTWIEYNKVRMIGKLGLNLMVINHATGAIHSKNNYNTHSSFQFLSARQMLRNLPPGMIVLGVVHSDWTLNRGDLERTLSPIVSGTIQYTYDGSWAFVGYTGNNLPSGDFTLSRLTFRKDRFIRDYTTPIKVFYSAKIIDHNECASGRAYCGENTLCRNTPWYYVCECKEGYTEQGSDCVDIDECKDGTAFCGSGATCTNTPGSYKCTCPASKHSKTMPLTCKELSIRVTSSACSRDTIKNQIWCDKAPMKIEVNGVNVLKLQKRGFNVILLDGNSGKVEKIDAFDTWLSNEESTRMVKLLKSVGNYKIIVGSVLDDSLKHLSKELLASIKALTGVETKVKQIKGTFAFIGYTGPGLPPWVSAKSSEVKKGTTVVKARLWALPKPPIIPLSLVSPGTSKQSKTAASLSFLRSNYAKMLKPGFNIVVISYWTGAVESVGQFNTKSASSPDVKKMENFLNTLPVDRVVLGIVKGEAYNGVKNNAKLKKAMERVLGEPMKLKSVGASYAFIGSTYVGKVHKPSCVDQVALDTGKGPAVISKLVGLNSNSQELKISLISTGCDDAESQRQPKTQCQKAQNSIKVNGEELSLNGKGVNVVAINRINGHVLHRKRFDTSKSDAESVKMASFITSLPKTSVVVGVVKNNAYGHFHSNRGLTNAMRSILGVNPAKFVNRGAYAFIGYKGKYKQSWVQQKFTAKGKGGVTMSARVPLIPELQIELVSTTCDDPGAGKCVLNKNSIKVNGKEYSKNGRGFNIVTIDFETGDIEQRMHFDTYDKSKSDAKNMQSFLNKLPSNKIVLGVVKDEAHTSLHQSAKKAIASLLHKKSIALDAYRQSYAFIGYTSLHKFQWIQEKRTLRRKGPAKITVGIPIPQFGCIFPTAPINGKVKRVEYDISQDVEYKCNKGHVLNGSPQKCGKHGRWKGFVPKCLTSEEASKQSAQWSSSATSLHSFSTTFFMSLPGLLATRNFIGF